MADGFSTNGVMKLRSEGNDATLQFGAYAGNSTLTIFKGDFNSGNRPTSITVNPITRKMMIECLQEVIKGAPGSKYPIIQRKWNNDTKTREILNVLCFGKDENGVIYLEIKSGASAPLKFPMRGDKNIERSGETDSDSGRSKHEAEALLNFMRLGWEMITLVGSRFNMPAPSNQKFSKGGGGGKAPAAPPSTAVSDDDWY